MEEGGRLGKQPTNSIRRGEAIGLYSDFLEQNPKKSERAFRELLVLHEKIAPELEEIRRQWAVSLRNEVAPFYGFHFWFPNQIGDYQVLNPTSQSAEETVCLARHLPTGRLVGLKLFAPASGTQPHGRRRAIPKELEQGAQDGVAFCTFELGETPILASTQEAEGLVPDEEPAPSQLREIVARRWERIRAKVRFIWVKPLPTTAFFATLAVLAGLWFQEAPRKEALLAEGKTPTLAAIEEVLRMDPADTEARALHAVLAAKERNRRAWQDFEWLSLNEPEAFSTAYLNGYLEKRLGRRPRAIPSPSPDAEKRPQTSLDFALLELTADATPASLAAKSPSGSPKAGMK